MLIYLLNCNILDRLSDDIPSLHTENTSVISTSNQRADEINLTYERFAFMCAKIILSDSQISSKVRNLFLSLYMCNGIVDYMLKTLR